MDNAILEQVKINIKDELGDAAGSLTDRITSYCDTAIRDIADYPYWSWTPASEEVANVFTAMPDNFGTLIEYSALSKIDSLSVRGSWLKMYLEELGQRKIDDLAKIGTYADGTNANLTSYRDNAYKDIAAYHQWTWLEEVPIELATTDDQAYVSIPSYLDKVISAFKVGDINLVKISWAEYARKIAGYSGVSNQPRFITKHGGRWYLYPTPNNAGNIFFFATIDPDQLSDDGGSGVEGVKNKIPGHFDNIVEYGILRRVDPSGQWESKFYSLLEDKRLKDGQEKGRHIRGLKDKAASRSYHYTAGGGALRNVSIWED